MWGAHLGSISLKTAALKALARSVVPDPGAATATKYAAATKVVKVRGERGGLPFFTLYIIYSILDT